MIFKTKHLVKAFLYLIQGPKFYGGGSPSTPSTTTQNVNSIPEQLMPYVKSMMGAAENQVYQKDAAGNITGFQPYKPFSSNASDYVANFSPMQQQAQQGAAGLQTPGNFGAASGLAGVSGIGSLMAGQNYQNQQTDPNAIGAYMSPYLQNVMQQQEVGINYDYDKQANQQQGRATQANAFGGSREALQASENEMNRNIALAGNRATGLQNAFTNAQQQQYQGAQIGLQGMNQAGQAAGTLGNLGQQGLAAQTSVLDTQNKFGGQQQAQQQQAIDQAVLDYKNAQNQPYMQLGTMSNLIRGIPMTNQTSTQYQSQPSAISQIGGLAATGIGTYGALNGHANGGVIEDKGYANGGIVGYKLGGDIEGSMRGKLQDLDASHLQSIIRENESPEMTALAKEVLATKYAKGGIVAFSGEDSSKVRDPYKGLVSNQSEAGKLDSGYDITDKDTDYGISDKLNQGLSYLTPSGIVKGAKSIHNTLKTYGENTANPDMRLPGSKKTSGINQITTPSEPAAVNVPISAPAAVNVPISAPAAVNVPISAPAAKLLPTNYQPAAANTPAEAYKAGPIGDQPSLRNLAANQQDVNEAAKQNIRLTNNPTPTSRNTDDIISPLREDVKTAQAEADKSITERIEEQRKIDEKYVGKDTGKEAYNESLKKEKEDSSDDARRMMYMRLMEFGANWGSTAGPPLVAGMQALKATLPKVMSDKKEEKATMRTIDKAIYEVNHADYLERKGQVQRASDLKEQASKTLQNARGALVTGALKLEEMNQKEALQAKELASNERRTGVMYGGGYGGGYGESKLAAKQSVAYDKAVDNAEKDMAGSPLTMSLSIEDRMKRKNELIRYYMKNDPLLKGLNIGSGGGGGGGGSTFDFSGADKIVGIK